MNADNILTYKKIFVLELSCVRDVPQPQPHPHLASLVVSDNAEGGRIVKGSKVEVDMASPFCGVDKGYDSFTSGLLLPRH